MGPRRSIHTHDGALGTERALGITVGVIGLVVGLIALTSPDVDRRDIDDDVHRS